MKLASTALVAAVLWLGAAPFGWAQDPARADGQDPTRQEQIEQDQSKKADIARGAYGSHLRPILDFIQASPGQRKKITEVVEEFKPKIEPMRQKYREKQKQFLSAMLTGKTAEEIMARQGELNALYGQITTQYCVMNIKVRRLLNTTQIPLYEQYRAKQGWTKTENAGTPSS